MSKIKGDQLEEFVHYVYSSLLQIEDRNAIVGKNVVIIGKSGAKNEFDVYYEFIKANIKHKVAIECKNHKEPVSKGKVSEFKGKLDELNNITGVMVSASGYQEGAKLYAKEHGILLLTDKDLPSISIILAKQIQVMFLPDENTLGEPFWTLMEYKNNQITGTYTCLPPDKKGENIIKNIIPLFISKKSAETFLKLSKYQDTAVRGVSQRQLKGILSFAGLHNIQFHMSLFAPTSRTEQWPFMKLTSEEIQEQFIID